MEITLCKWLSKQHCLKNSQLLKEPRIRFKRSWGRIFLSFFLSLKQKQQKNFHKISNTSAKLFTIHTINIQEIIITPTLTGTELIFFFREKLKYKKSMLHSKSLQKR
jgi:hypothetical protein